MKLTRNAPFPTASFNRFNCENKLSKSMTSNIYLNALLKRYCAKVYGGVYACNTIAPVRHLRGKSIIVNTAPVGHIGEHFVALKISRSGRTVWYFDSFGIPLHNRDIARHFLNGERRRLINASPCVQSIFSAHCGFFAAAVIFAHARKLSYCSLFSIYNFNNLMENDAIVTAFICNSIRCLKRQTPY